VTTSSDESMTYFMYFCIIIL